MGSRHYGMGSRNLRTALPAVLLLGFTVDAAYYGFFYNAVFFLEHLGLSSAVAVTVCSDVFGVAAHLTPLAGAYLADARWGRLRTIMRGLGLHLIGFAAIAAAAWPGLPRPAALGLFLTGLFGGLVLGGGCMRATRPPFGLDQFCLPAQARAKDVYLSLQYALSQIAGVSMIPLNALAADGLPPLVPRTHGFFAGFVVPAAVFSIGAGLFAEAARRSWLVSVPPRGSELSRQLRALGAGLCSGGARGAAMLCALACAAAALVATNVALLMRARAARQVLALTGTALTLAAAALLPLCGGERGAAAWAARGRRGNDLAALGRVCAMLPFLIVFWAANYVGRATYGLQAIHAGPYSPWPATLTAWPGPQTKARTHALQTRYPATCPPPPLPATRQACQMDQNVFGAKMPPAVFFSSHHPWLNILVVGTCHVAERCRRAARRALGSPADNEQRAMLRRMAIGHWLIAASMLCAAAAEIARRASPLLSGDAGVSSCPAPAALGELRVRSLSLRWFVPQILCAGMADYLYLIGAAEFFYTQVPRPRTHSFTHPRMRARVHAGAGRDAQSRRGDRSRHALARRAPRDRHQHPRHAMGDQ